ncbi:MAG: site-specific integrase [Bacteroides sp.]|nr:site-specific integrase [Bacteroides sp.]
MANLKACVRRPRKDGFWQVYIRVTHQRNAGFIKTDKMVTKKELTKTNEIKDPFVLSYCSDLIIRYNNLLNTVNIDEWDVNQVIDFLTTEAVDICFSDYAKIHTNRMINEGHERNAKNYKLAVAHLERYVGTNKIMFGQLTSAVLKKWIETLRLTNRAKEMYPVCVRQIFRAAILELNDEEKGIVKIKFNPWNKVKIPKADKGTQRAISAEACREFFNRPLPQTKMLSSLPELGRDVALLVLCLGGINTVDLFNMQKSAYCDGRICYNRAKTRNSRSDNAYIEMRVEPFIQPIFDKYLASDEDPYLFNFHCRYCDSDSFSANVNNGIKKICADMKMKKEDYYCVYTFRHTWGTIAQNDCDANLFEVAFGMNHSSGFNITRGYVKVDFSPAWRLNAKVIEFIFFTKEKSKQGKAKDPDEPQDKLFRISPKKLVHGRAYFKGELLAEIKDIGFSTVESVISVLVRQLPDSIPDRAAVQFRITNVDAEKEVVYERTKGKGF